MSISKIAVMLILSAATLCACSDDDAEMSNINVKVAVRVDSHVPPSVTVFGTRFTLSNDNWYITQGDYRTYAESISVPTSSIRNVPSGPLPSNHPDLQNILSIEVVQGKRVFTVLTETTDQYYLFILK